MNKFVRSPTVVPVRILRHAKNVNSSLPCTTGNASGAHLIRLRIILRRAHCVITLASTVTFSNRNVCNVSLVSNC
jgi:hypothetical protein